MDKIFEIHPNRPIPGILPNCKRIMEPTKLSLNRSEFIKCMNMGTVYAVVGNDRVLISEDDYEKALKIFDKAIEYKSKTITFKDNK